MHPQLINEVVEHSISKGKQKILGNKTQAQVDVEFGVCAHPNNDSYSLEWLIAFDAREKVKAPRI